MSTVNYGSRKLFESALGTSTSPIMIKDIIALIDVDEAGEIGYYPHELITRVLLDHRFLAVKNDAIIKEMFGIETNGFNIIYYSENSDIKPLEVSGVKTSQSIRTSIYAVQDIPAIQTLIDFTLEIASPQTTVTETSKLGSEISGTGGGIGSKIVAEWSKGTSFTYSSSFMYKFTLKITQEVKADQSGRITLELIPFYGVKQRTKITFKSTELDGNSDGIEPFMVVNMDDSDSNADSYGFCSYQYYWDHAILNYENQFEGMGLIYLLSYQPRKRTFSNYAAYESMLKKISKIQQDGLYLLSGLPELKIPNASQTDDSWSITIWNLSITPILQERLTNKSRIDALKSLFYT